MNLLFTSIIPIELFTTKRRDESIHALKAAGLIAVIDDATMEARLITELGGSGCEVHALTCTVDGHIARLVAQDSSLCIVIHQTRVDFAMTEAGIRSELAERNAWHTRMIENSVDSPISTVLDALRALRGNDSYGAPTINYVFSFYTLEHLPDSETIDDLQLKLLAEPSLLDIDDMLSTRPAETASATGMPVKPAFLHEIIDCDIAHSSRTYITWATAVSCCARQDANRTRALLTALECKLQIVWNRCHSVSNLIDAVFQEKNSLRDISDLYWSFVLTLDDARAVISSTFSSRANRMFAEMVRTSHIDGEIARLAQKLQLLEKYVTQRNQRQSRIYQKSIELLLFVTALATLVQILFPVPLSIVQPEASAAIVAVFAITGTIAIFKSK